MEERAEYAAYTGFYQDFLNHKYRLTIRKAVENSRVPTLAIHGTKDEAVSVSEAEHLQQWNKDIQICLIPEAGHTFGSKHPWEEEKLPEDLQKIVEETISFARSSVV